MSKLLILTMCCNQPLFQKQEYNLRTKLYAKDILDKKFEDVDYWTYTASTDNKYHINKKLHKLEVPCDDSLNGTYDKTYKAFKLLNQAGIEYDYIFRTNCSTYVNVKLLKECIDTLDDNCIYSGGIYCSPNGTGPFEWCLYGVGNSLLLPKYWIDVIINNHVSKFKNINKVHSESESYYTIDDNAIGLVVNSYALINKMDMYDIWQSFKFPIINSIPKDPYNYIAIPFRIYNNKNIREEENEELYSNIIHESMNQAREIKFDYNEQIKANRLMHIIDFDKHTRSIVNRDFGDEFLNIMSLPKYLKNLYKQ